MRLVLQLKTGTPINNFSPDDLRKPEVLKRLTQVPGNFRFIDSDER